MSRRTSGGTRTGPLPPWGAGPSAYLAPPGRSAPAQAGRHHRARRQQDRRGDRHHRPYAVEQGVLRRDIAPAGQNRKEVEHPLVGRLSLEATQLRVPARPDLVIVLHTPLPDTGCEARLQWLASPEDRRGSMYPVPG
ncbi:hypothetical protein [Streptomyces sp. MBT98]|uniref:MmyB family transcriptional regulator n=1 Tax=unclassified Streptomyces TaxID=2593676 RepID=UPI0035ABB36D